MPGPSAAVRLSYCSGAGGQGGEEAATTAVGEGGVRGEGGREGRGQALVAVVVVVRACRDVPPEEGGERAAGAGSTAPSEHTDLYEVQLFGGEVLQPGLQGGGIAGPALLCSSEAGGAEQVTSSRHFSQSSRMMTHTGKHPEGAPPPRHRTTLT